MHKIYKYNLPFDPDGRCKIKLPLDARVLTIAEQLHGWCIWAIVNPNNPPTEKTFRIIGTGWDIEDADSLTYIATRQDDALVWHFFQEGI